MSKGSSGAGKSDYASYEKAWHGLFNTFLVEAHNGLLAGQKQYGYSYTLEGRNG